MSANSRRRLCPTEWRKIARELHVHPLDTVAVVDAMARDLADRMRMRNAELDALDAAEAVPIPPRIDPPALPPRPHRRRGETVPELSPVEDLDTARPPAASTIAPAMVPRPGIGSNADRAALPRHRDRGPRPGA
jgi:hypothetical protein